MKNVFLTLFSLLFLGLMTIQAQTRLAKSVKVPNFILTDVLGEKVNLQVLLKENQKVLICFFRPVWCPICNKRTHELIERYEELKSKGIEVVAIYPTRSDIMAQYVKDANIPFPVIADPEEALYEVYSIERSMKKIKATLKYPDFQKDVNEGTVLYGGKVYLEYPKEGSLIINADFILSGRRQVEVAYYGDYIGDHYDLDAL